jgi:3-dehydroquinate dehydratase
VITGLGPMVYDLALQAALKAIKQKP